MSVPQSLRQPPVWVQATSMTDSHRLLALKQSMAATAAIMTARVPAGMSLGITGSTSSSGGEMAMEVSYAPRSVPAGIDAARLVLTITPASSGGSLLRADAQVVWFPPRTAAEYIDPARYHVLVIAVTTLNPRAHSIDKVVTSRAAISRLAGSLNQSRVDPITPPPCPLAFATYRLGFAAALHSRPVVVITASLWSCGGATVSVGGRMQPPLENAGTVIATVDRLLEINPEPSQQTGPATPAATALP